MIEYYPESKIAAADDARLRELLATCFPMLPSFRTSRYWMEPCDHRWVIRQGDRIIANAAVHEKVFRCDEGTFPVAGVAYVAVHPDWRRRGLVRQLLAEIHAWAVRRGFSFAFLFGRNEIYRSSGYVLCRNDFWITDPANGERTRRKIETAHVHCLSSRVWPTSAIDLQGPVF